MLSTCVKVAIAMPFTTEYLVTMFLHFFTFQVTIQNSTNQEYVVYYEKGSFVAALVRYLQSPLGE